MNTKEGIRRIKAALKNKTGRAFSVTSGYHYITIQALPRNRVEYDENPEWTLESHSNVPYHFSSDRKGNYTSDVDCMAIAMAMGKLKPVHFQGFSFKTVQLKTYVQQFETEHFSDIPEGEDIGLWSFKQSLGEYCNITNNSGGVVDYYYNEKGEQVEVILQYSPRPQEPVFVPEDNSVNPVVFSETKTDLFLEGIRFPKLNKNDSIADYREQLDNENDYHVNRVKVTHSCFLSTSDYNKFVSHLLDNQDWLAGLGGASSDADLRDVEFFHEYTDEEQDAWRSKMYIKAIAVSAPGCNTIYVNPEGFGYARYVGFV